MPESQLVDQFGRPIERAVLAEEHGRATSSGVRSVWREGIASKLTPLKLGQILRDAANGDVEAYLELAEEMEEREAHYASVLGVRKLAVSSIPMSVASATDDKRDTVIADALRDQIASPAFRACVFDLLDGLGKGFSAVELMWKREASAWTVERFEHRDARFFLFDQETGRELRLRDLGAGSEGLPLAPYKWIVHVPKLKTGLPIRGGLARFASVAYLCKSFTVKDWMAFAEVYGLPLRVGKFRPGTDKNDIRTLVNAIANIGSDAAAVIPDSMRIEFEQPPQAGAAPALFEGLATYLDKQVSKLVLGQTMTTDDGSSLGQAKIHDEVRQDIRESDAVQLEDTLDRDVTRPFVDLNFGPQKRYPRIHLRIKRKEDLVALAKSLPVFIDMGMRVEESVLRDKFELPEPPEGARLLTPRSKASAAAAPVLDDEKAANRAGPGTDAIDEIEATALDGWRAQVEPIVDPVRSLFESAASYDELLAGLERIRPQLDSTAFTQAVARAMFEARARGLARDD